MILLVVAFITATCFTAYELRRLQRRIELAERLNDALVVKYAELVDEITVIRRQAPLFQSVYDKLQKFDRTY